MHFSASNAKLTGAGKKKIKTRCEARNIFCLCARTTVLSDTLEDTLSISVFD